MTANPITADYNDTLRTALRKMASINVNHLPVLDSDGHLVGIVSDRDVRRVLDLPELMLHNWEKVPDLDTIRVRQIMTAAPIIVEPHAPAEDAARLMLVNHISSLPVMRAETLVGIVTKSDILVAYLRMVERQEKNRTNLMMVDSSSMEWRPPLS
ncbi:MAG: CBS domain-containing protein [Anaerolineae bacterium]